MWCLACSVNLKSPFWPLCRPVFEIFLYPPVKVLIWRRKIHHPDTHRPDALTTSAWFEEGVQLLIHGEANVTSEKRKKA